VSYKGGKEQGFGAYQLRDWVWAGLNKRAPCNFDQGIAPLRTSEVPLNLTIITSIMMAAISPIEDFP
jgi:hypothetical protein